MKKLRNFMLTIMAMVSISLGDSEGIGFVVAATLCIVPAIVLGIEGIKELNKRKAYEKAKANSENPYYLLDLVEFGELEMMEG